ncbi:putative Tetratricopeptide repeat protein [Acidobacteriia bacterium SbA2]|nr:putative Tetratricopeptide repeat protein [Acidobacteriia bacterium SbA2]
MRKILQLFLLLLGSWQIAAASEVHAVLVFPFENRSTRADLNWVSESFAETIASRLSGPDFYVLNRTERDVACTQLGIPSDTPLTVASEFKVAQTLGADWVVFGRFNVEGAGLTATARLLDLRKLKLSPPIAATGELAELVDLQTRLVWLLEAAHDPHFTVGTEEDFSRKFPQVRLDAFENYMRGVLATDDPARIHFLEESDRLNPSDHRAAFALGRFYFDQKDYANSAKWLKKLNPGDAHYLESLFFFGVDEYFLGHYPSSKTAFEKIGREIPLNEIANNAGVLATRAGQDEQALEEFERAHAGDPTDADYCFNRGVALWNLHRHNAAATSLEEAIKLRDDDSDAHTLLAVVLEKQGDAAGEKIQMEWLHQHQMGLEAHPSRDVLPQPRLKKNFDERAFLLLSLAVHNALEERLAAMPADQHAAVHKSHGKTLVGEGRLAEAERELAEATSLAPSDSEAHLSLAEILEAEDKPQEAAAEFQTALKLKDSFAGHLGLARAYLALNHRDQARLEGEAALKLDPDSREAQEVVGRIISGMK